MKYKLTEKSIEILGHILFQIQATADFGIVKKDELGGYIEKEENLSQDDNAWVYGNARVFEDARVFGNAEVYGNARVFGDARVYGNARVYDNAWVYGNARVFGDAEMYGNARVYGNAWVSGNAEVYGKIKLQFGWCFGRKEKDWNVTEVENEGVILLIKDYKPTKEELISLSGKTVKVELDGKTYEATIK